MVRVVVVGAGIVGAAVAYESARLGADVVLLDRSLPASGVTGDSFAWIGGPRPGDEPDGSTPLRRTVLEGYRRWEREVPGLRVRWRGSLHWTEPRPGAQPGAGPEPTAHVPQAHAAPGGGQRDDERLLGAAEVARLEPHLRPPPAALHRTGDGALDPVAVTEALVRAARDHGARVQVLTNATALRVRDGRVVGVETSSGFLGADTVALTAGADAPVLCAPLGVDLPVLPSPALLLRFSAPPGLVRTLVVTPDLEVREGVDGELLVTAAYDGHAGRADLERTGREVLGRLLATVVGAPDVRLLGVRLGARPMPVDGLPVVGPLGVPEIPGVYVAVMHSAITLAPAVAPLVAAELVHGVVARELAGVRPSRFAPGGCGCRE